MSEGPDGITWVLASGNAGKAAELRAALAGTGIALVTASEAGVPELPEETGASYEENALLKAAAVAVRTGRVTLADDSGLEVDALGGEPGVHSARFGGDLPDGERMAYLLRRLRTVPDERRTARFVCVLVLAHPDGDVVTFRGACEGRILQGPRGDGGHGYDPVFQSADLGRSFGEATLEEKNRVSHRARALRALRAWLDGEGALTFARSGTRGDPR